MRNTTLTKGSKTVSVCTSHISYIEKNLKTPEKKPKTKHKKTMINEHNEVTAYKINMKKLFVVFLNTNNELSLKEKIKKSNPTYDHNEKNEMPRNKLTKERKGRKGLYTENYKKLLKLKTFVFMDWNNSHY